MTDKWEEATESLIGEQKVDRSWDFDIDFDSLPQGQGVVEPDDHDALQELWPEATKAGIKDSDLVVFDPMGFDLAGQLTQIGFQLREAQTGVDVMTLIAARPTGAVVCGPAEDAERRRLLTAAVRLRFPTVPVVYVSTHAGSPAAVEGAKAEGAEVVIKLPLPPAEEVRELLKTYASARPPMELPPTRVPPVDDAPATQLLSAEQLAEQQAKWEKLQAPSDNDESPTRVMGPPPVSPLGAPDANEGSSASSSTPLSASATTDAISGAKTGIPPTLPDISLSSDVLVPGPFDFEDEPTTARVKMSPKSPSGKPYARDDTAPENHLALDREGAQGNEDAPESTVVTPIPQSVDPSGEVGALLGAISPFLWGLEDAAKYVEELAATGDAHAASHARTLKLLTKLLTQLKQRIDDLGI